jgi:hypothetical protein
MDVLKLELVNGNSFPIIPLGENAKGELALIAVTKQQLLAIPTDVIATISPLRPLTTKEEIEAGSVREATNRLLTGAVELQKTRTQLLEAEGQLDGLSIQKNMDTHALQSHIDTLQKVKTLKETVERLEFELPIEKKFVKEQIEYVAQLANEIGYPEQESFEALPPKENITVEGLVASLTEGGKEVYQTLVHEGLIQEEDGSIVFPDAVDLPVEITNSADSLAQHINMVAQHAIEERGPKMRPDDLMIFLSEEGKATFKWLLKEGMMSVEDGYLMSPQKEPAYTEDAQRIAEFVNGVATSLRMIAETAHYTNGEEA